MTLSPFWAYLDPIQSEIIGLAFTLIAATIFWMFRPRVKLIYGRANNSINHVVLPDPADETKSNSIEIYSEKFFLQNMGRKPASDVEFVLSHYPTDIGVWQPRNELIKEVAKGNCMITIPKIAPQELVIIDCVYINLRAAWISSVKCSEAVGKEVPFQTVRRFPNWVNLTFLGLALLGCAFLIQLVLKMLGT